MNDEQIKAGMPTYRFELLALSRLVKHWAKEQDQKRLSKIMMKIVKFQSAVVTGMGGVRRSHMR